MFNTYDLNKEESWFLGLFHSDGNLFNNRIKFEMKDEDIIYKLRAITGGSSVGYYKKNSTFYYRCDIRKLNIKIPIEDLQIIPKKSLVLTYPNVNVMKPDYLRGIFDGDGTFGRYKQRRGYTIKFAIYSASLSYAHSLFETITSLGFDVNFVTRRTQQNPIYSIQKAGSVALDFLEYIYKDSIEMLRLNRKFEKYLSVLGLHKLYKNT